MRFTVGMLVKTWFDDGWHGTILYGRVEKAGPKAAIIRWESGLTNRIRQFNPNVKPITDPESMETAAKAMAREDARRAS